MNKRNDARPCLIVPTLRSVFNQAASLALWIIALRQQPVKSASARVRPLGGGRLWTIRAGHLARAADEARLPPAKKNLECYVTAGTAGAQTPIWPVAPPAMDQTGASVELWQ